MTFLRLLKKYLTGEIASKLGVEPNEVEETLKTLEKNKKGIVKKENSINTNQNG
jgi:Mn-dependent DtxR family transcriptional regulator